RRGTHRLPDDRRGATDGRRFRKAAGTAQAGFGAAARSRKPRVSAQYRHKYWPEGRLEDNETRIGANSRVSRSSQALRAFRPPTPGPARSRILLRSGARDAPKIWATPLRSNPGCPTLP